jgi:hypothetical protein
MQKPSQNGRQQAKDSLSIRTKNRYLFRLGLLFPIDIRRPCKYNSSLGSGLALTHSVRKDPRPYIARPDLLHFFLNSVGLDLSFISSLPCPRSLALQCCCKWSPTGKARGTYFTPRWGDIPAKGWRIHPRPKAVAFCCRGKRKAFPRNGQKIIAQQRAKPAH